jgi:hypothetical protein
MSILETLDDLNPWWRDQPDPIASRHPYRRHHADTILAGLLNPADRRARVLVGPRQVGKTVLLKQLAQHLCATEGWPPGNVTYFDFDDDRIGTLSPREVVDVLPATAASDHPRIFLLDELGKAKSWDRWLKQAVDRSDDRFVVTDSAATLLRDRAMESGPGRWDEIPIEGLTFGEWLDLQSIETHAGVRESRRAVIDRIPGAAERYLRIGGFPEFARRDDPSEARRKLRTDIADRAILHDLLRHKVDVQRVRELFVCLVQESGAIIVKERLSRQLADPSPDSRTLATWLELLGNTRLVVTLPKWEPRARARLRSKPRMYAADHGLVVAFAPGPTPWQSDEARSSLFETVVFRHLRELERDSEARLSYFRTKDGLEADFVLETNGPPVVIEVTSSSSPKGKLATLAQVGDALRTDRLFLIRGGPVGGPAQPAGVLPLQSFLENPRCVLEAR